MQLRYTLLLAGLLVAVVFTIATIWEFGFVPLFIEQHETGSRNETAAEHWESVVTAVISAVIALILVGPGFLWLITECMRRKYKDAWADNISESEKHLRQATELAGLGPRRGA